MSRILVHDVVAVMIHIVCHLNLVKRKIILFSPVCHCGISLIAVPVNILADSFIVDMLTVFRVESPIIVKRIINPIFSRSSIMPCAFQFTFPLSFKFSPKGFAAKLLKVSVSVTDSTQYHMAKRHITGQWLPPLTC